MIDKIMTVTAIGLLLYSKRPRSRGITALFFYKILPITAVYRGIHRGLPRYSRSSRYSVTL